VFGCPFFGKMPQYIYSLSEDGLYVNLYSPSTITAQLGGRDMTVQTRTDFPHSGHVDIQILKSDAVEQGAVDPALHVRIPGWVDGDIDIKLNGQTVLMGKPSSYVTVTRPWASGDILSFDLPMTFKLKLYTGLNQDPDHERYAVLYGPVLLALLGADDLDMAAADLPGRLTSVEGKPLHFSVQGLEDVRYVPYWQIQKEHFTCFPTMR
jgi:DUF1680 family protein